MNFLKKNINFATLFFIIFPIIVFCFVTLNVDTAMATCAPTGSIFFDPGCGDSTIPMSGDTITLGDGNPFAMLKWLVYFTSSFLGFLFLCLIIYAGVLWMTARGNEEQITKAQTVLKRSLIGLIIVISSVSIAYLIYWVISQSGAQNLL